MMRATATATKRRGFKVIFASVVLTALFVAGTSAIADDWKVFPGSQCQPEYPSTYGDSNVPRAYDLWGGAYANYSETYDHVNCPIARDQTRNTNGTAWVQVRIYQSGKGRGFWCELWSSDVFGGAGGVSTVPAFPVPLQTHHVDASAVVGTQYLGLDTSRSKAGGYYSLHCELPPGGYIYSYQVREFPDTGAN